MKFVLKLVPDDYFKWHYKFFVFTALEPPNKTFWKKVFWIFYVPHFLCFSVVLSTLEYIRIRELLVSDFNLAMYNLPAMALHLICDIRIFLWHLMLREKYFKFVELVDQKCDYSLFDVDNVEYINSIKPKEYSYEELKQIHKVYGSRSFSQPSQERLIIENYHQKKYSKAKIFSFFYASSFCYGYFFIMFFLFGNSWLQGPYEKFNPHVNRTSVYRKYGYEIHFPFDVSTSDGNYFLGLLFQFFLYTSNFLAGLAINTLGVTCIIQAKVPLDVVKVALKNVDKNISVENKEDRLKIIDIRIVKCINEIQRCIRSAELIEEIFSATFLIQFTIMTLILTLVIYTLLLSHSLMEAMAFLVQVILMLFDPFCLCWFSQNFTEEFANLVPLIFKMDWVNYSPNIRRKLIITMMRLKKPVSLTLGGMTNVDLQFYMQLLKSCYSYLTILTAPK